MITQDEASNPNAPLVSVIIPTYNSIQYIEATIKSILDQEYKNIEIVVIDDGSTDGTVEFIKQRFASVSLFIQNNSGVCAARNSGFMHAKGQYICFLDHDDYWYPDKLAIQLAALESHAEYGVVYSSFIRWFPGENGEYPSPENFDRPWDSDCIDSAYSGWIYHLTLLDSWVLTSSAVFKREVLEKCGVFDVNLPYSEDWDLWLRVAREYPFLKLRKPTVLYRQHSNQGSRVPRTVDYRSELIIRTMNKWGLCSKDGKCISKFALNKQISRYQMLYGLEHVAAGNKTIATKSFLVSFLRYPGNIKAIIYIFLMFIGWRPSYY